jgi:transposase
VPARQAVFLFLRRASELEADEQETLAQLRSFHPEVDQAYELVQQFAQMLRTRTGEQLDAWLEKVRASQIRELQGFVLSVERDKAAVVVRIVDEIRRLRMIGFAAFRGEKALRPSHF